MQRSVAAVVSLILLVAGAAGEADALRERPVRAGWPRRASELEDEDVGSRTSLPPGVRVIRDVAYGSDERQRFDVYLPAQARKNAPVIFMVHGGGWRRGDKESNGVVANKIARWVPEGFVFISVNYRMVPDADAYEQARDVARALATAQSKASTWGGDRNRFILMGHSAGAHLVSLVATSESIHHEVPFTRPTAVVSLDSAAMDVERLMSRRHFRLYDPAFGADPTQWAKASPCAQLTRNTPPILAVCSSRRADSCDQAEAFVRKAKSLGVVATVLAEDLSHREINVTLGEKSAYTDAVKKFLGEQMK